MSSNHFVETNKMVEIGSGAGRNIPDIALTRYACYLIAQNGDPTKKRDSLCSNLLCRTDKEAGNYEKRLFDIARVSAREKPSKSEKKLSGIIYERGIDDKGFGIIKSKGDSALFGGFSTQDMKRKLLAITCTVVL